MGGWSSGNRGWPLIASGANETPDCTSLRPSACLDPSLTTDGVGKGSGMPRPISAMVFVILLITAVPLAGIVLLALRALGRSFMHALSRIRRS